MTEDDVIAHIAALEGVVVWTASPGDGSPEIAWGDSFAYCSPDGTVPAATQPFATVVTKDHPDDVSSQLNRPGTFRVNIHAGKDAAARVLAQQQDTARTGAQPSVSDLAAADVLRPHPTYGRAGWLAVINPGERTEALTRALLTTAWENARSRH
ncbi:MULTISPECIES: DUF6194 family protein [unclassified Modestobacter]|uniref:DUF6194 family protein n=1 Tax=unclassified Modestobacter TaxID=2643866 RepID=UPI0022AAACF0|nr:MULTISPECIES: DUF6194 family protein [unclassified Modestobacter]MCZ2822886.1 DUF6194 family protein [Modestobacter sp. VKM Ac-2981]MCZ2851132.1 DUF6194 family protein [Modestobacter sp. VKM Ac-2982]